MIHNDGEGWHQGTTFLFIFLDFSDNVTADEAENLLRKEKAPLEKRRKYIKGTQVAKENFVAFPPVTIHLCRRGYTHEKAASWNIPGEDKDTGKKYQKKQYLRTVIYSGQEEQDAPQICIQLPLPLEYLPCLA